MLISLSGFCRCEHHGLLSVYLQVITSRVLHPLFPANEVLAAAAEVLGVPGGWKSPGGSAGAPRRADAAQVQHRPHPRAQRVRTSVTCSTRPLKAHSHWKCLWRVTAAALLLAILHENGPDPLCGTAGRSDLLCGN